jgi:hypothetical protein
MIPILAFWFGQGILTSQTELFCFLLPHVLGIETISISPQTMCLLFYLIGIWEFQPSVGAATRIKRIRRNQALLVYQQQSKPFVTLSYFIHVDDPDQLSRPDKCVFSFILFCCCYVMRHCRQSIRLTFLWDKSINLNLLLLIASFTFVISIHTSVLSLTAAVRVDWRPRLRRHYLWAYAGTDCGFMALFNNTKSTYNHVSIFLTFCCK